MQCHHNINTTLNLNLYHEIVIRLITFGIHWWLNHTPPFMRQIKPNELWLYQYPVTPSYVSPTNLWLIVVILPTIILFVDYYIFNRNKQDVIRAILALTLGYPLTCALTSIIKVLVGRPRPDFYYRCFPDGNGTDMDKCTGDKGAVDDGRKSFPSGHSSLSFCCSIFITLYLIKKVQLSSTSNGKSWKLCVMILPLLLSTAIAISRTCDYHHHYEDIIAGSILGSILSYIIFKIYFNNITTHCNNDCVKK